MPADTSRSVAFKILDTIHRGAYANLALRQALADTQLADDEKAWVTELVSGVCRAEGTYDAIIAAASGRKLNSLQPAVLICLRIGTHQLLNMNVPTHAAVNETVQLGKNRIGVRVAGLLNAVLRKVAKHDLSDWLDMLGRGLSDPEREAFANHHPPWIAASYRRVLPKAEVADALAANNRAPRTTLVVRPGVGDLSELIDAGCEPVPYSPYGAYCRGNPADIEPVRSGRAGVQDEGSQLAALLLTEPEAPSGPWLDLCAGPGGKSALLAGLAPEGLCAAEVAEHRAQLVAQNLMHCKNAQTVVADGRHPAWQQAAFARVLADVPCTGLGALRRRPESRWRKSPDDLKDLTRLQRELLSTAIWSAKPGGVIAYVTCSPHPDETHSVVDWALTERPVAQIDATGVVQTHGIADALVAGRVQLWPHRHSTDAMFIALLRKSQI